MITLEKIFPIILLSIFLISFTSAIDQDQIIGYGSQKSSIDIKYPCRITGNICDSTYLCNLTVYSPNGDRVINNKGATRNSSDYNITLLNNYTVEFGFYRVESTCSNNINNVSSTYFIEITADGKPSRNFPFVYMLLLLGIIFLLLGKYLDKLFKSNVFNIFAGMFFLIGGILGLYPGFNYTSYYNLQGLAFGTIFIGIGGLLLSKELESYT